MFWSTASFELAANDDMRAFPLRSLLTPAEDDSSNICGEKKLARLNTQYYDARSSVKDIELERWESMNGIHHLFNEHDEVRKVSWQIS